MELDPIPFHEVRHVELMSKFDELFNDIHDLDSDSEEAADQIGILNIITSEKSLPNPF